MYNIIPKSKIFKVDFFLLNEYVKFVIKIYIYLSLKYFNNI